MKKILLNILLVLISLTVGFFVAEIIVREVLLDKFLNKNIFQTSIFKDVVYEYKPDIIIDSLSYQNLKLNSNGFRDYEFDEAKKPYKIRIICLGDSATFGHGIIETKNTLPKQLESILNKGKDNKYQVYNMGVQGYNTHHELAVLKHKVFKFKPDIVILIFNFGDVGYDWLTVKHGRVVTALNFPPVIGKILPENINNYLLEHSATYFFLELLLSKNLNSKETWGNYAQNKASKLTSFDKNFGYDLKSLKEFNTICKKNNVRFIIAIMPWLQFPITYKSPEIKLLKKLETELMKDKIEYIDLFNSILYEKTKSDLSPEEYTVTLKVCPKDNHPNEKALSKYALEINKYIYQKRMF